MTLYYSLVFALLVMEMVLFGVLVLPLPLSWRRRMLLFVSQSKIVAQAQYGLKVVFVFVAILFLDSVNRMQRVEQDSNSNDAAHVVHDIRTDTNLAARKFYAQRNMYLTGFTLFLSLILNRTYSLIVDILKSEEKLEAYKKQTATQSAEYDRLIKSEVEFKSQIEQLTADLEEERRKARDFDTLKKQSQNQSDEFLRLTDKYNELEKRVEGRTGESRKNL